jgi:hypothetical protein
VPPIPRRGPILKIALNCSAERALHDDARAIVATRPAARDPTPLDRSGGAASSTPRRVMTLARTRRGFLSFQGPGPRRDARPAAHSRRGRRRARTGCRRDARGRRCAHRRCTGGSESSGIAGHGHGRASGGRRSAKVRSASGIAIRNCGLTGLPSRITVNLAPADLPKQGTSLDLPVAMAGPPRGEGATREGRLGRRGASSRSTGRCGPSPARFRWRSPRARPGSRGLVLPEDSALEAAALGGLRVHGVRDLSRPSTSSPGRSRWSRS